MSLILHYLKYWLLKIAFGFSLLKLSTTQSCPLITLGGEGKAFTDIVKKVDNAGNKNFFLFTEFSIVYFTCTFFSEKP